MRAFYEQIAYQAAELTTTTDPPQKIAAI